MEFEAAQEGIPYIQFDGDPVAGARFAEMLPFYQADPDTDVVVIIGELGGTMEEVAEAIVSGGKGSVEGKIIATEIMVKEALIACEVLKAQGISVRVLNIHTDKSLDSELVLKAASEPGVGRDKSTYVIFLADSKGSRGAFLFRVKCNQVCEHKKRLLDISQ